MNHWERYKLRNRIGDILGLETDPDGNPDFLITYDSDGEPEDGVDMSREVTELVVLVSQAIEAERTAILKTLPEKKSLETDTDIAVYGADDDPQKFCVECGQYEFEGQLNCRCCGFNEAIAQVTKTIMDRGETK